MTSKKPESAPRRYKVLSSDGRPIHGGSGQWSLPVDGRPGDWMPTLDRVRVCDVGYHLTTSPPSWLRPGCRVFLAEGRGASESEGGKTAYASARLLREVTLSERDLRLLAADCAEHVLPIYEARYPRDTRPRMAIEAARAYARGEISSSAGFAASAAASAAAAVATTAAYAAYAASAAASDASASAVFAASDAASDAEREWQRQRWEWYVRQAYPEVAP